MEEWIVYLGVDSPILRRSKTLELFQRPACIMLTIRNGTSMARMNDSCSTGVTGGNHSIIGGEG